LSGDEVGAPRDGDSGQRMANWARHPTGYHRRFCDLRTA
jgi:hypothetical protein